MAQNRTKKIVGILGGIGSGKSSVAEIFENNGCEVINADKLAHTLLDDESIKIKLKNNFTPEIFNPDNTVNRRKLAQIAFADTKKVQTLNNIIHPPVMEMVKERIYQAQIRPKNKAIVLDIPLLMEVGWEKKCDILIFVDCERKKRIERAAKKGNFFKKQLKIRENCQISLDKKRKISDYIVNNNSDLSTLNNQVEKILRDIL